MVVVSALREKITSFSTHAFFAIKTVFFIKVAGLEY